MTILEFQSATKYNSRPNTTVKSYPTKLNPLKVNYNKDSIVKYLTTLHLVWLKEYHISIMMIVEFQSVANRIEWVLLSDHHT